MFLTHYDKFTVINSILSSEEGPEHNNKIVRDDREHHSRQNSLQNGLYDTFLRSTHRSDPEILKIIEKSLPKKSHQTISPEVMVLLEESDDSTDSDSDSNSNSDSNNDSKSNSDSNTDSESDSNSDSESDSDSNSDSDNDIVMQNN